MKKNKRIIAFVVICVMVLTTAFAYANERAAGVRTYEYKEGFKYSELSPSIKKRITGKSYKKNPNISYSDLRYLTVKHYNYKNKVVTGELIVNKKIAKDMLEIFYKLYEKKYQIQKMKLIDDYNASDNASMADNNTSAFNYRVMSGTNTLSRHAYGMAIDINPRVNPFVNKSTGLVSPRNGGIYKERDVKKCKGKYKHNMLHKNDFVVKLFEKYGFSWGYKWQYYCDYQHFQK
ncbi:MAG: M15 family metallopeptidase [Anaerovoracaceae bacterium]